ncbi:MAG: ferrous iron transport protein A [Negativicutes bacterium]|nr:ferrous iron transport protein A [Negativicutes bacterium]
MRLADLATGDRFRVKKVTIGREIGKRIVEMGFVNGREGQVVRRALLGDPIAVQILNYCVSLRLAEARGIEVEKIDGDADR